jgi:hypothetical protein
MASALLSNKFINFVNKRGKQTSAIDPIVFGQKMDLVTKLFGCWHGNISRPFIEGKTAYRSCLKCGARKPFNPETLETRGNYYFPPFIKDARI